jgi:intracellular sulfur oxidation DsrE/DsrF family protein
VTRTLDKKNVEIAICDMTIQSQPLSQDQIWTVDLTPYRSFVNRDFEVTKTLDNKNVDFAICDIVMQSQQLNQE